MRVDSHHHLWRYEAAQYGWITGDMHVLQRDYDEHDLEAALRSTDVEMAVAVQARQSLAENDDLLAAAARSAHIAGVVGWVDLRDAEVGRVLERYAAHPAFRGVRHIVQAEPDGFLDDTAFNHGISRLRQWHLVYDILILGRQLSEAITFVDRHPGQPFVLDHLAKPTIRSDRFDAGWAEGLRELARRPHVSCKVSGMVTEVRDPSWSVEVLRPYVDLALECFGPERLMTGSDWPVCRLRAEYATWMEALAQLFGTLSADEQTAVFGGTAGRVYGLDGLRA